MPSVPRSSIPMVVGVLMIVLASIGLMATAVNLHGATRDHAITASPSLAKMMVMIGVLDGLVGLMHLTAGIAAVRYRRGAPDRAVTYALARILLTLGTVVALLMFAHGELGRALDGGFVAATAIMIAWPIVVI